MASMRPRTLLLFALLLACVALSASYFYTQHQGHLQHSAGSNTALITKEDHDRFLKAGIHCEESYVVQGYEGPEAVLRMFSLSQQDFRALNPGVGIQAEPHTVLCVRGMFGVEADDVTAFNWFWPVTATACAACGFAFSHGIRVLLSRRGAGVEKPDPSQALPA
ncbi:hypothetical protein FOA52_003277 [Chlamydomonas sp. UWO 241]|nr:hypothetical protein FOA52_003277 [Chlamydomonas sp. UWO 241]